MESVLAGLGKRERELIEKHYKENMPVKKLTEQYGGVSASNIQKKLNLTLIKLSSAKNISILIYGLAKLPDSNQIDALPAFTSMPIDTLDLSTRSLNVLKRMHCVTIADIISYSTVNIKNAPCAGIKTQNEIIQAIHRRGLLFANEQNG